MKKLFTISIFVLFVVAACNTAEKKDNETNESQTDVEFIAATDEFSDMFGEPPAVEKIDFDFEFTEGPVWSADGYWLFSDIPANTIYKWKSGDEVEVFVDSSFNSNGLAFDKDGNLIACEHGSRTVSRYNSDGSKTTIATHFKEKKLNSPNDLTVHSSGAIFFTDPPWGLAQQNDDPAKELSFNGVFLLKDTTLYLIDSMLSLPNGIALSPDENYLYVSNTQFDGKLSDMKNKQDVWMRYELSDSLTIVEKSQFIVASDYDWGKVDGAMDGMKTDKEGNIFASGPGGVVVFNSSGKYLGTIKFPGIPTNLAFGGQNNKTLLVTVRKNVYAIRTK